MEAPKNFVLIGRSGSGKGTQAKMLMEKFSNLVYVSTGDLFRALSRANTAVAKKITETLRMGNLPFDDLATTLWMHEIAFNVKEGQGFIMDGAPRRVAEAQNLDRFLEWLGWDKSTFYLLIDISRKEAFRRMLERGRPDDNPDAINGRLDYYDEIASKVEGYYESQGRLMRINGEQSIQDVHKDIITKTRNA